MPSFILNEDNSYFEDNIVLYLSRNPIYENENNIIYDY
jgi:hypothetical protein